MNNRNELPFNRSIRVLCRWRGAWSIANERPNHDLESGMVSISSTKKWMLYPARREKWYNNKFGGTPATCES